MSVTPKNTPPTSESAGLNSSGSRRSPGRAVVVGALGVAFLCAITPYNDYHLHNTFLYGNHLPIGCLFLFTILALAINPWLKRRGERWGFSAGELLLIWAMVTCGSGLASSGLWRYLGPMVVAPVYFANSGSPWLEGFAHAPGWLLLTRDKSSDLALWFYQGLPRGQATPWAAWLPVVVAWGLAFGCFVALSLGLMALFRRQWITNERLSFPLAQVPLQLVGESNAACPLVKQPLFWAGCATVIFFHAWSTAHAFTPAIPDAPDRTDLTNVFTTPPWNALGFGIIIVYFSVVGVMFLLPTDVSLTLWLTFIGLHLFRVLRVVWGYDAHVAGPLDQEGAIGAGAFLVWAFWLCYTPQKHWRAVWQALVRPKSVAQDDEPLTARAAVLLVVVALVGLVVWMHLAGIGLAVAVVVLGLMCVILLVLSRIMAEAGLLFLMTPFIPTDLMAFWGTRYYTLHSATAALLTEVVFIHDPRENIMPAITNAFALTGRSGVRARTFTKGIALAIAIGFVVSFFSFVGVNYHYGAVTLDAYGVNGAPHWSLDRAMAYARQPLLANAGDLWALGSGAALTAVFAFMKSRFVWWPFGPIGLAMGGTLAMNEIWFSVFLGWLCKAITFRFGGLTAYRYVLPYFVGLIIGEGIFAGISVLWGMTTGNPTPQFLPG